MNNEPNVKKPWNIRVSHSEENVSIKRNYQNQLKIRIMGHILITILGTQVWHKMWPHADDSCGKY